RSLKRPLVLLLGLGVCDVALAATWTVGQTGDFSTLRGALDNAELQDGDEIVIQQDYESEHYDSGCVALPHLVKSITIRGQGSADTPAIPPIFTSADTLRLE